MKAFLRNLIAAAGVAFLAAPGLAQEGQRPVVIRADEQLAAFAADGTSRVDLGAFLAPSYAPDGGAVVVFVPNGQFLDPAIVYRSGEGHYLFPEPTAGTFLYRPVWSPDGRSIALIRYLPSGFAFVVVDVETAQITAEGEIPHSFTADFPYYTAGIDTFAWSPDSRKVVLSWKGVLVFDVETEAVQVASDGFALAFWAPDSAGVCLLQYGREGPNPAVLEGLGRFELETGVLRNIASPEDLARAGIAPAQWFHIGAIQLSPDGGSVALSMGNSATGSDAVRIYDAAPDCLADLARPRRLIDTGMVAVMDWAPDGSALAVIEQVPSAGPAFSFEARVIDLETGARTTLIGFELEGLEVDVLGLIGLPAWSH